LPIHRQYEVQSNLHVAPQHGQMQSTTSQPVKNVQRHNNLRSKSPNSRTIQPDSPRRHPCLRTNQESARHGRQYTRPTQTTHTSSWQHSRRSNQTLPSPWHVLLARNRRCFPISKTKHESSRWGMQVLQAKTSHHLFERQFGLIYLLHSARCQSIDQSGTQILEFNTLSM
jgi:hypothetical protein